MKFHSIFVALLILLSPVVYSNNFGLIGDAVVQASEVTEQQVAELYVATFNRAPDSPGLTYWASSSFTIEQIAMSFFDQSETQALYPQGNSASHFVTSIYQNLFSRDPDAAGLAYWAGALGGGLHRSVFIEAVKNGAMGNDKTILDNKTVVGLYYANKGMQEYFALSDVTGDLSSVESVKTVIDELSDSSTPTSFTMEWLAGKTLFGVWFGKTDNSYDGVGVVKAIFRTDTYLIVTGLKNYSTDKLFRYFISTRGELSIYEGVNPIFTLKLVCGSTQQYIKAHLYNNSVFNNVELLFFNESDAMTYANSLTTYIPSCNE